MSKTISRQIVNKREEKIPTDLKKALLATPKVLVLWKGLTPIARRDFITWIESAKQADTRARRIAVTESKLLSGQRRPCCYAVVPMHLYKALGDSPRAKAVWSTLTPDERRDFVSWVEDAETKAMKGIRIEKVCALLASGKRHP